MEMYQNTKCVNEDIYIGAYYDVCSYDLNTYFKLSSCVNTNARNTKKETYIIL